MTAPLFEGSHREVVWRWVQAAAKEFSTPVIEVGSKRGEEEWWADYRSLCPPGTEYMGVDISPGPGVDHVLDGENLPWNGSTFGGGICAEVLEHAHNPLGVLCELRRVIQPGAPLVVTTLAAYPLHGYPTDFWRFTPSGLELLLTQAGFRRVMVSHEGVVTFSVRHHTEEAHERTCPMHSLAVAWA